MCPLYGAHTPLLILCLHYAHTTVTLAPGPPALAGAHCTSTRLCYDAGAGTGTALAGAVETARGRSHSSSISPSPQRSLAACVLSRRRAVELDGAGARGNACKGMKAGQSEVRLTAGAPGACRTLSMLLLLVFGGLRLLARGGSQF